MNTRSAHVKDGRCRGKLRYINDKLRLSSRTSPSSFNLPHSISHSPFSPSLSPLLSSNIRHQSPIPKYDVMITRSIETHPKLSQWAQRVEVAGDEHSSKADPDLRVSGQIFNKEGMRITSGHWYKDGRVVYSRNTFNK